MMPRPIFSAPASPNRLQNRLRKPPGLKPLGSKRSRRSVNEILSDAYRRHTRERETLDALRLCLEEEETAL